MKTNLVKTRSFCLTQALLIIAFIVFCPAAQCSAAATPVNIGSRLELMLDDYLVESMDNLTFLRHSPVPAECVLKFDDPWDGPWAMYVTIFKDGDIYRMYYASMQYDPADYRGDHQFACYAESTDGINWVKPSLGLYEFKGTYRTGPVEPSKDNNILFDGYCSHNFTPFIDTRLGVLDSERYKAVGGNPKPFLFSSADGIHWKLLRKVAFPKGHYDSHNVAFWDTEKKEYAFYCRYIDSNRYCSFARSSSDNFIIWTKPKPVSIKFNGPKHGFYTNGTIPYFRAPHLYISLPMRMRGSDGPDGGFPGHRWKVQRAGIADGIFLFSRDGMNFSEPYMESFIRPGPDPNNWSKHGIMPGWGMLQLTENETSIYCMAGFYKKTCHIRRYTY